MIALIEPDKSRGLSVQQVHEQILQAADHYMDWGIDDAAPRGPNLINHMFANEPIEWNRIGHFQVNRKHVARVVVVGSSLKAGTIQE